MTVDLFLKVLNLSISAVPLMAVLLVLRLLFKKAAPRKVFYIAWALVFLRLMVPVSFESDLSFFNFVPKAAVVEENVGTSVVFVENENERVEFPVFVNPGADNPNVDMPYHSAITGEIVTGPDITTVPMDKNFILSTVWIFGTAALLIFGIIGYFAVLRKLKFESIEYTDKIRLSEFFKTPVVCGLIRPKIILPMNFDLDDEAKINSVISHECTHIRRGDNFWRLLATFTLYVHWFNPLVWICYNAFIRDMEVSCDEAVLSGAKNDIRGEYAESLVALAGNGTNPLYGGVLSFGECAIKERVKCIMNFKKTTLLIVILCIAAAAALGVIFLTNPSATSDGNVPDFEVVPAEGTEISYSRENGVSMETVITNNSEKTIWLDSATIVQAEIDGKEEFAGSFGSGGVLMLKAGESALFCGDIPMDNFEGDFAFHLPEGKYTLKRAIFLDEALTPTPYYAEFSFEIETKDEIIPAERFYGRVMEGSHLGSFVPDQSNMPIEDVFGDAYQKKYCENIIDGIVPETVERFYVTFSPNDETTYREIEYFYMEDILFLLQNMELTVCEAKNPNTGGLTSIYFQTTAGNITIQNNGGFLTVAKENDSVRYAFDAELCKTVFDEIEGIARGIMSGELYEEEINPAIGSGTNENPGSSEGPAPVQIGEEYLIPYNTGVIAGLFCNSEKTYIPVSSATVLVELREILAYSNFKNFMRVEETETSELGKTLEGVDVVEFARADDGKKYTLSLYENGFILNGSAVDEKDKGKIWIVEKEAWSNFRYIVKTMFENASFRNPYWLGLANEKNVDIIWVTLNKGNFITYNNEMDCFELLVPIIKGISVEAPATRLTEATSEEIVPKIKDDYIHVSMNFFTDTVYDIYLTETELYIVSNDMKYSLYYKLSEPGVSFNELYSFAVEEEAEAEAEANPATAKPVIYLYPEKETEVTVKLDFDGRLTYTYPELGSGWRVFAKPDGTLTNLADNSTHYYLFWEGVARPEWTYEKGFVVKGSETETFLRENLAKMGLTPREYNDFITYWVPRMQENPYNLISFSGDEYSEIAKLTVNPKPDTLIRIHMVWKALDEPIEIEPQVLPVYVRKGFTLVEWGGTEIF